MAAFGPTRTAQADSAQTAASGTSPLAPPRGTGPAVVQARFELHRINDVDDGAETFEFTGVLMLRWHDVRQAFDPAVAGISEKIFQGSYQIDELATRWYPQVVLVNESGLYETSEAVLRVQPDGTSTLIRSVNASVRTEFDMSRFPFDRQRLQAIFEVLGFDRHEVVLQVEEGGATFSGSEMQLPQWRIRGVSALARDRSAFYAGPRGVASAFILGVDVERESFYVVRLVIIPLIVIVLLSFSVFWMDPSLLNDRLNISFIGILTGVAYQILMNDQLPRISYFTFMHAFLSLSFLTMCATVVVNLMVGRPGGQETSARRNRIDHLCRWGFPAAYFGLMLVMTVAVVLLL